MQFESLKFKLSGQNLSVTEFTKLTSFIFALNNAQHLRQVSIIYRGESYANIKTKLNLVGDSPDFQKMNDFVFLIGEKGRAYQKAYRNKVKKKYKLFNVDDTSNTFFSYIFRKFNDVLKLNRSEILSFRRANKKFSEYFLNVQNEEKFLFSLNALAPQDKLEMRDYYLRPLHHAGSVGYYNNSILVSTSTDLRVSEKFSKGRNTSDSIIFVSWFHHIRNSRKKTERAPMRITKTQLPYYRQSFFPNQKEISLKGGILPHYLIGYIKQNGEMELNPNLFSTQKPFKDVISDGFDIDQRNFVEKLKETDYSVYFTRDELGNYWDSVD